MKNTKPEPGQEIKGGLVGHSGSFSDFLFSLSFCLFVVILSFCLFELGQDPEIKGGLVGDEMTMEASQTYPANSSEWTEMKLISVLDFPNKFSTKAKMARYLVKKSSKIKGPPIKF